MPPLADGLIAGLVAGVTAAIVAWATMRVHLYYLRRDLHRHDQRIAELEAWRYGTPRRRRGDLATVPRD